MNIHEWACENLCTPLRIILYVPAPDIIDEHGNLSCGGEWKSTVVYDSTGDSDLPFDLALREITAINEGDDGITELEYIPDEYCVQF